tara:strand:- start:2555 stop:2929 length:375 start_codon:yes stop_codon:yes gene_type:complete
MKSKKQFVDMFSALDSQGIHGLFPYLNDDVRFRFASYPEVRGHQPIKALWEGMSTSVIKLQHHLDEIFIHDNLVSCYGLVTYHLQSGQQISVPFANRFVINNDKISEYHIYVDASAVLGIAPVA